MRFDFAIALVPGNLLCTADSLPRSPQEGKVKEPEPWNDQGTRRGQMVCE